MGPPETIPNNQKNQPNPNFLDGIDSIQPTFRHARRRSLPLIDQYARTCPVDKLVETGLIFPPNQDFLVVAVVGLAASGKSTVASSIAGQLSPIQKLTDISAQIKQKQSFKNKQQNSMFQFKSGTILDAIGNWEKKAPFRTQQIYTRNPNNGYVSEKFRASALGMRPETNGIDIYTTHERVIIIDTPPLFGEYFTITNEINKQRMNRVPAGEKSAILNASYLISWLNVVAHQIVVVSEPDQVLNPLLLEAIRLGDMLCPRLEYNTKHSPELIFVENKIIIPRQISVETSIKEMLLYELKNVMNRLQLAEMRLYPSGGSLKQICEDDIDLEEQNKASLREQLEETLVKKDANQFSAYQSMMQEYMMTSKKNNNDNLSARSHDSENGSSSSSNGSNGINTVFNFPNLKNSINYLTISNWNEYLNCYKREFNENILIRKQLLEKNNRNSYGGSNIKFNAASNSLNDQRRYKIREKLQLKKTDDSYFDLVFDKDRQIYGYLDTIDAENFDQNYSSNNNNNNNSNNNLIYDKNSIENISYQGIDKEINNEKIIRRKKLNHPDQDLKNIRRIVTSGARTSLFYIQKPHPKDSNRKLMVRCTELDWVNRAQEIWTDMITRRTFQDFMSMMID